MKKLVSLLLAVVLVASLLSVAFADDTKKVTLRVLGNFDERNHKADRSDCLDYQLEWYDVIRHLLPGYEIEIDWMLYEDSQAQIPLLLAANDIPDIFLSNGTTFMEYYDTGYFVEDLRPLVDQYGKNILAGVEERSLEICTLNGKLAAIPSENFYYKFRTIIRMDWVKKLGFEEKKVYTISELEEILLAMVQKDPDGNGKDDTTGIGARFNGGGWPQTFMPIFGAFGGSIDDIYIKDNVAYPFNYSDDFRAALSWLAKMYAAGAIDTEAFILNYDQALIKAGQGKAGFFSGWWNVMANIIDAGILEINPDAELAFIYVTSDDGKLEGNKDNGTIWKTTMISAACPYPEAAVAFIDFMNTTEGRWQGNPAILDENGQFTYEDGIKDEFHKIYKYIN